MSWSEMSQMSFCPARDDFTPCPYRKVCAERAMCALLHCRPIDALDAQPAVHFVGFRGEEYRSAVRVFGEPDFVHRTWDRRATLDVAPADTVVFAKYHDQPPSEYSFDDSNQADDPAALERYS